jgi:tetratricopeptide (TPR) repeat protein
MLEATEALLIDACSTDDEAEQLRLADAAVEQGKQLVEQHRGAADAHYMLALCWYHHPTRSRNRSDQVRDHLDIALGLDRDHQFANQYLAYINLDELRFEAALARLERTNYEYFREIGQVWRALKAQELTVVCRLRTGRQSFDLQELRDFTAAYLEQFHEDPSHTTWPLELQACAEWLYDRGETIDNPILATILRFLEEIGRLETLERPELVEAWKNRPRRA